MFVQVDAGTVQSPGLAVFAGDGKPAGSLLFCKQPVTVSVEFSLQTGEALRNIISTLHAHDHSPFTSGEGQFESMWLCVWLLVCGTEYALLQRSSSDRSLRNIRSIGVSRRSLWSIHHPHEDRRMALPRFKNARNMTIRSQRCRLVCPCSLELVKQSRQLQLDLLQP